MKRILIVTNNLNIGGIQKSLVDLLCLIAPYYDITLYCVEPSGMLNNQIPTSVKIIEGNKFAKVAEYDRNQCRQELGFSYFVVRVTLSMFSKYFGRKWPAFVLNKMAGKVAGEYDLAISYTHPFSDDKFENLGNEIVLQQVNAKRKACFIHCDYSKYGGDCDYNRSLFRKYDKIVGVSRSVAECFANCVEGVTEKMTFVYNWCKVDEIKELSIKDTVKYDKPTFVSVSRLSEEKGLSRCLHQMKKLMDEGKEFKWVMVGDGVLREELEKEIKALELSGCVEMVGTQKNPYKYIKDASYLILLSFHEAAPMVYNEAACLGIPILTTNTLSAKEIVEERGWGIVCSNDDGGIYQMLSGALTEKYNVKRRFRVEELGGLVRKQFEGLFE